MRWIALLPLILLAGCGGKANAPAAPGGSSPTTAAPAGGGDKSRAVAISPESAAGVAVGMDEKQVRALPNLTVDRLNVKLDGVAKADVLSVTQFGVPVMLAELKGDKVSALRIYNPRFRGPKDSHPGSTAKELAKSLGKGSFAADAGGYTVTFAGAPGYSYHFLHSKKPLKSWDDLTYANSPVQFVRVHGAPMAGALDSAAKTK